MKVRNYLYDIKILPGKSYPIPVICIGNITVGGSGKTPMTELLIRLLQDKYRIAVVSRGYGRHTKGMILAERAHTSAQIGDEPAMYKRKYPHVTVVVDGNRRRALHYLCSLLPEDARPGVILMDDGFQHRSVTPYYSILLVPYHTLTKEQRMLPAGRLREPIWATSRANAIVVSKFPEHISPIDRRILQMKLDLFPYQLLLSSAVRYHNPIPVFPEAPPLAFSGAEAAAASLGGRTILGVAGVAHPQDFFDHLRFLAGSDQAVIPLPYPDHHVYRPKEFMRWEKLLQQHAGQGGGSLLCCTEKDVVKIWDNRASVPPDVRRCLYVIGIETVFKENGLNHLTKELDKVLRTFSPPS